jgi:hypothetical protein
LLRDALVDQSRFPLRFSLKVPSSAEMSNQFDAVRVWVSGWAQPTMLRVEWQQVRHRVLGMQQLPVAVWLDTQHDALQWLGQRSAWRRFLELIAVTQQQCPELLPWLEKRPLQALDLYTEWPRLLAVVAWLQQHPQPGIYLRQVDVPGVHSKFIEAHRVVLAELLDRALPSECIDTRKTGITQFAARYGFVEKPQRIRFRLLDPSMTTLGALVCPDITLDANSFSQLRLDVQNVLITENETNFLALPALSSTLAIFGSGYGWEALAPACWLAQCRLYYWGDIDTHGFAILDQLRGYFPHVESVMMDEVTLRAHQTFWGTESKPSHAELTRLTPQEQSVLDALRHNRIGTALRLEQEHIGFDWVQSYLNRLCHCAH